MGYRYARRCKISGYRWRRTNYRSERPHIQRSEEHTSELQSPCNLVCRLLLEKKKNSFLLSSCLDSFSKEKYWIIVLLSYPLCDLKSVVYYSGTLLSRVSHNWNVDVSPHYAM